MILQVLRYFDLSIWHFGTQVLVVVPMPESVDGTPLERKLPLSLLDTFDALLLGVVKTVSTADDDSPAFASLDDHLYTTFIGFSSSKCRSMSYFEFDCELEFESRIFDVFSGRLIVNCARTIHSAVIFGGLDIFPSLCSRNAHGQPIFSFWNLQWSTLIAFSCAVYQKNTTHFPILFSPLRRISFAFTNTLTRSCKTVLCSCAFCHCWWNNICCISYTRFSVLLLLLLLLSVLFVLFVAFAFFVHLFT